VAEVDKATERPAQHHGAGRDAAPCRQPLTGAEGAWLAVLLLTLLFDSIDSIYRPWLQDFTSYLLSEHPHPDSVPPIPDDQPLPPRYILRLASAMDIKGGAKVTNEGSSAGREEEDDRQFLANRDKNAALSHTTRPMSALEQFDADYNRMAHTGNIPYMARLSESASRIALGDVPVSILDKANVLKDHPAQYLLRSPPPTQPTLPPLAQLYIPKARVAHLESNTRVTPPHHWQDVRRLKLSLRLEADETELPTQPGSTITIFPKNFMEDVDWLIHRMDWDSIADSPVEFDLFKSARPGRPISLGTRPRGLFEMRGATLRKILANCIDFTAIPTRMLLEKISQYASDARQREKLVELTQGTNSQEFYDFTSRPRRTILELLQEFDSVMVPFDVVPDIFPVIRGREFSIANGGYLVNGENEKTRIIEILVALVEYKTIIRKPRQGLCSRYIKHLPPGLPLHVVLKTSGSLRMDEAAITRPLIAIATGTGIAPIRSLIYERECAQTRGDTLLFFGCRNKGADFYYQDEWKKLRQVTVIPAFSRDAEKEDDDGLGAVAAPPWGDGGRPALPATSTGDLSFDYDQGKNYVQHLIRKHAEQVCRFYAAGAYICICGNSGRMPISVRQALIDAAVLGGFCSDIRQATALFDEKNPKHIPIWQETW